MSLWNEWVGSVLVTLGVIVTLIAAIGLIRMPDVFSRMHASSKPQMLGILLMMGGCTIHFWSGTWVIIGSLVLALQILTVSTGSHMQAYAAYLNENPTPTPPQQRIKPDHG